MAVTPHLSNEFIPTKAKNYKYYSDIVYMFILSDLRITTLIIVVVVNEFI